LLGSLFHDIGHLIGEDSTLNSNMSQMIHNGIHYGVEKHEKLGANFLRKLDVPEKICYFVENHIAAKRYLIYKVESFCLFFYQF
jgi:putative nucleotidyltransferase with HDIG domain